MKVEKVLIFYRANYSLVLEVQKQGELYAFSFYSTYNQGGFGKLLLDVDFSFKSLYSVKAVIRTEGVKLIRKYFRFNKGMIDELVGKVDKLEL